MFCNLMFHWIITAYPLYLAKYQVNNTFSNMSKTYRNIRLLFKIQEPSCFQHQFGRTQSCLGGTVGQMVQREHCPWFLPGRRLASVPTSHGMPPRVIKYGAMICIDNDCVYLGVQTDSPNEMKCWQK